MISSLIPSILFLFVLLELDLLLLLFDDDVFDELGDDVDELFVLDEFVALFALLLLFELPLLPPEDPAAEDPPDCFSFLSLIIIIYTTVTHLFISMIITFFFVCFTFAKIVASCCVFIYMCIFINLMQRFHVFHITY